MNNSNAVSVSRNLLPPGSKRFSPLQQGREWAKKNGKTNFSSLPTEALEEAPEPDIENMRASETNEIFRSTVKSVTKELGFN